MLFNVFAVGFLTGAVATVFLVIGIALTMNPMASIRDE